MDGATDNLTQSSVLPSSRTTSAAAIGRPAPACGSMCSIASIERVRRCGVYCRFLYVLDDVYLDDVKKKVPIYTYRLAAVISGAV